MKKQVTQYIKSLGYKRTDRWIGIPNDWMCAYHQQAGKHVLITVGFATSLAIVEVLEMQSTIRIKL